MQNWPSKLFFLHVFDTGSLWLLQVDGLMQDCGNYSVLAMELPQSCTEPLMCFKGNGVKDMHHFE